MTNEQVRNSIETGYLSLNFWKRLFHYSFPGLFFFISAMFSFYIIKDIAELNKIDDFQIWWASITFLLGIVFVRIQKNRLKLKPIQINLSREELSKIVEEVAKKLEWFPYYISENVIIAKTHPGFFSGSWGEQITVIFEQNTVYVNSICDPDKQVSVISAGRNKENRETLISEIIKANNN